jgi:hypothetical protein
MSHKLGRVVTDGRTFNETAGLDLVPPPGALGGPRFVILHLDNVTLSASATLTAAGLRDGHLPRQCRLELLDPAD